MVQVDSLNMGDDKPTDPFESTTLSRATQGDEPRLSSFRPEPRYAQVSCNVDGGQQERSVQTSSRTSPRTGWSPLLSTHVGIVFHNRDSRISVTKEQPQPDSNALPSINKPREVSPVVPCLGFSSCPLSCQGACA